MTLTNAHRGEVSLPLDGREVKLVPSFANLVAVEKALDCGFLELAERLGERTLKLADIACALGLAASPRLSQDEAAEVVEEIGPIAAYAKFGEFLAAALFPLGAEQSEQQEN